MNLLKDALPKLGYVGLALIALSLAVLLYWLVSPSDVLEVKNAPVPVRTIREHPTAAGVVILKIDYCKKLSSSGDVRISFVSSSREIFLPRSRDRQAPVCEIREVPIIIPEDISQGEYHVHFRATYRVNPLKQTVEEFDSQPFEIVDTTNPPGR
jgi:hypothetical protein